MRGLLLLSAVLALTSCWKGREMREREYLEHRARQADCKARRMRPTPMLHGLERYRACWYSAHLAAMGEPELERSTPASTYRFLWLRTFDNPVTVRAEHEGGRWLLTVKRLDGAGGYAPGTLTTHRVVSVSESAFQEAVGQLLSGAGIWNKEEPIEAEHPLEGLDGAQWILEATDEGRYRVVDLWTPEAGYGAGRRQLAFRNAMLGLLRLGGIDTNPLY